MIVVKAEALGFEFAPVVGRAFVPRSPRRHLNLRASFTKKQNSETRSAGGHKAPHLLDFRCLRHHASSMGSCMKPFGRQVPIPAY